jgi:hypothetical protein
VIDMPSEEIIEETPYSPSAQEIVESMAPAATIESVLLSIATRLELIEAKLDAAIAKTAEVKPKATAEK